MIKTIITSLMLTSVGFSASALALKCTGETTTTIYSVGLYTNTGDLGTDKVISEHTRMAHVIADISHGKIDLNGPLIAHIDAKDKSEPRIGIGHSSYSVSNIKIEASQSKYGYGAGSRFTDKWFRGTGGSTITFIVDRVTGEFEGVSKRKLADAKSGPDAAIQVTRSIKGTCKSITTLF